MTQVLDWAEMRRRALTELGLQPQAFWDLTPIEFLTMLGHVAGLDSMRRDVLDRLCREFPDERTRHDDLG